MADEPKPAAVPGAEQKPSGAGSYELKYYGIGERGESFKVEVKSAFLVVDTARARTDPGKRGATFRYFSDEWVDLRVASDDHLSWSFGSGEGATQPSSGSFVFHYPHAFQQVPGRMLALFFEVTVTDTLAGKTPRVHTQTFPLLFDEGGPQSRCFRIIRTPGTLWAGLKHDCHDGPPTDEQSPQPKSKSKPRSKLKPKSNPKSNP